MRGHFTDRVGTQFGPESVTSRISRKMGVASLNGRNARSLLAADFAKAPAP